jgi:hypothetical protein
MSNQDGIGIDAASPAVIAISWNPKVMNRIDEIPNGHLGIEARHLPLNM